eukprot:247533-Hanusia_phi.AAC.3
MDDLSASKEPRRRAFWRSESNAFGTYRTLPHGTVIIAGTVRFGMHVTAIFFWIGVGLSSSGGSVGMVLAGFQRRRLRPPGRPPRPPGPGPPDSMIRPSR